MYDAMIFYRNLKADQIYSIDTRIVSLYHRGSIIAGGKDGRRISCQDEHRLS